MAYKYILSIIKRIFPKNLPNHLGRWRIEKCNKKIDSKIDLSNEDHCGPCGQYVLEKIVSNNNKNSSKDKSKISGEL